VIFGLFGSGRARTEALETLSVASEFLPKMRAKFAQEGEVAIVEYATGVGEVAGLLAGRFGVSVPSALILRGVSADKLKHATSDLLASIETGRQHLKSQGQTSRAIFHRMTFGGLLFYYFCSTKHIAIVGPEDLRDQANYLSGQFAVFARVLGEISIGARDPADACLSDHQLRMD
jgi:hypothetical protein